MTAQSLPSLSELYRLKLEADTTLLSLLKVSKAATVATIEADLSEVMISQFRGESKKIVKDGAEYIASLSGNKPLTKKQFEKYFKKFEKGLSKVSPKTREKIYAATAVMYNMERKAKAVKLGIKPIFNLVDEAAKKAISDDAVYWIGQHYNRNLSKRIKAIVQQEIIEKGIGRKEAGKVLKNVMQKNLGIIPGVKPTEGLPGIIPKGWTGTTTEYFQSLAGHVRGVATSFGTIESLVQSGSLYYTILAVGDERTCPVCGLLDGQVYPVQFAVQLRNKLINAETPDEVKVMSPWLKSGEIEDTVGRKDFAGDKLSAQEIEKLVDAGIVFPPFHFKCRCEFDVAEVSEIEAVYGANTKTKATPPVESKPVKKEPKTKKEKIVPPTPPVPKSKSVPKTTKEGIPPELLAEKYEMPPAGEPIFNFKNAESAEKYLMDTFGIEATFVEKPSKTTTDIYALLSQMEKKAKKKPTKLNMFAADEIVQGVIDIHMKFPDLDFTGMKINPFDPWFKKKGLFGQYWDVKQTWAIKRNFKQMTADKLYEFEHYKTHYPNSIFSRPKVINHARGTAIHESGHWVDYRGIYSNQRASTTYGNPQLNKELTSKISKYSSKNEREFFAELFCMEVQGESTAFVAEHLGTKWNDMMKILGKGKKVKNVKRIVPDKSLLKNGGIKKKKKTGLKKEDITSKIKAKYVEEIPGKPAKFKGPVKDAKVLAEVHFKEVYEVDADFTGYALDSINAISSAFHKVKKRFPGVSFKGLKIEDGVLKRYLNKRQTVYSPQINQMTFRKKSVKVTKDVQNSNENYKIRFPNSGFSRYRVAENYEELIQTELGFYVAENFPSGINLKEAMQYFRRGKKVSPIVSRVSDYYDGNPGYLFSEMFLMELKGEKAVLSFGPEWVKITQALEKGAK